MSTDAPAADGQANGSETATDGGTAAAASDATAGIRPTPIDGLAQVGLVALFVTSLITAQVTATKLVGFGVPAGIPLLNETIIVPAAVGAYALTFFASDCYAELYGRRAAQLMVNVAFVMNFVLLALVWVAIELPVFVGSPVAGEQFATVLQASLPIVVGSLAAYVVSQNWDVIAFHRLREYTDGDHLWLRNVGSTTSSQAIDTVIFITVAFWLAPTVLGMRVTPLSSLPALIAGQFLVKLLIALGDTPFVYAVVGAVRSRAESEDASAA